MPVGRLVLMGSLCKKPGAGSVYGPVLGNACYRSLELANGDLSASLCVILALAVVVSSFLLLSEQGLNANWQMVAQGGLGSEGKDTGREGSAVGSPLLLWQLRRRVTSTVLRRARKRSSVFWPRRKLCPPSQPICSWHRGQSRLMCSTFIKKWAFTAAKSSRRSWV